MQRTFIHSTSMETPPQTSLDNNAIAQITASVSAAVLQQIMMHIKTTGGVHQSQSIQTLTPQSNQSNHLLTPQSSQSNHMLAPQSSQSNHMLLTSLRQSDQMLSLPSTENMEPSLVLKVGLCQKVQHLHPASNNLRRSRNFLQLIAITYLNLCVWPSVNSSKDWKINYQIL